MLQNVGGDIVKEPTQNARETLSDINLEELVLLAKQGDKDALERVLNELTGMVRAVARSYFFLGADSDDVIQEGMIGLFMAVMNFEKSYSKSSWGAGNILFLYDGYAGSLYNYSLNCTYVFYVFFDI